MQDSITIVGLDTAKNSIAVAIAEPDINREVRYFGKIGGDMASLDKALRKLESKGSKLHFVYEAGPCGYEVYRHLTKKGHSCTVVAPSLIPKKREPLGTFRVTHLKDTVKRKNYLVTRNGTLLVVPFIIFIFTIPAVSFGFGVSPYCTSHPSGLRSRW